MSSKHFQTNAELMARRCFLSCLLISCILVLCFNCKLLESTNINAKKVTPRQAISTSDLAPESDSSLADNNYDWKPNYAHRIAPGQKSFEFGHNFGDFWRKFDDKFDAKGGLFEKNDKQQQQQPNNYIPSHDDQIRHNDAASKYYPNANINSAQDNYDDVDSQYSPVDDYKHDSPEWRPATNNMGHGEQQNSYFQGVPPAHHQQNNGGYHSMPFNQLEHLNKHYALLNEHRNRIISVAYNGHHQYPNDYHQSAPSPVNEQNYNYNYHHHYDSRNDPNQNNDNNDNHYVRHSSIQRRSIVNPPAPLRPLTPISNDELYTFQNKKVDNRDNSMRNFYLPSGSRFASGTEITNKFIPWTRIVPKFQVPSQPLLFASHNGPQHHTQFPVDKKEQGNYLIRKRKDLSESYDNRNRPTFTNNSTSNHGNETRPNDLGISQPRSSYRHYRSASLLSSLKKPEESTNLVKLFYYDSTINRANQS